MFNCKLYSAHHLINRFTRDRSGAIVVVFGLALPVILLVVAGAVDYAMAARQKSRLQGTVDAATLAAASELSLSNSKIDNVGNVIQALVEARLAATNNDSKYTRPTVQTVVETSPIRVKVTAKQPFKSLFGSTFGFGSKTFTASAVAAVVGRPNICVLALHPTTSGALSLEQNARATGENCGVYSNSTHSVGVKAKNSAVLKATTICSAGGVQGGGKNFDPPPYLDCPTFEDPLGQRPEPTSRDCDIASLRLITTSQRLKPGTFCGGLIVTNGAQVELDPGIYAIKNGPFVVTGGARIAGKDVGIFMTGAKALINFEGNSYVELEAPTSGPMAGLLIFSSRETTRGNQHKIYSENAQVMVGTIYVPTSELRIDGAADIGSKSAYTAIVAQTVRLYGGPHIVLNTSYDETGVPVPEGVKGAGQPVHLVE